MNELYLENFKGSIKELIRIGLRNKWINKKELLRLIESEKEDEKIK